MLEAWLKKSNNHQSARFVYNALRQLLGAGIFFVTTLILNQSLTRSGYAIYFSNWNVANLIVAFVAFGLYNEIIRRLSAGHTAKDLLRALWLPHLGQLAALVAMSRLVALVWSFDWVLILAIVLSTTYGNLLVAISLGRDQMRLFMAGELTFNIVLLVLAFILRPQDPRAVGGLFIGALLIKLALYAIAAMRGALAAPATAARSQQPLKMRTGEYTTRAYAHSLLQIALFRGFFMAADFVLGPQKLALLALPWSFCDRSLLVIQGITQLLYPQLLAGTVTSRMKKLAKFAALAGFLAATLGMAFTWAVISWRSGQGHGDTLLVSFLIAIAFIPHVLRQLQLNEALAEYRFLALFSSHAAAFVTFILVMCAGLLLDIHAFCFPIALVFSVSVMGLIGFRFGELKTSAGENSNHSINGPTKVTE